MNRRSDGCPPIGRSSRGLTRDDRVRAKFRAVKKAEADGIVADSLDVRKALIQRMEAGELTLAEAQAELAKLKRTAKKNGQTTRAKVWRQS